MKMKTNVGKSPKTPFREEVKQVSFSLLRPWVAALLILSCASWACCQTVHHDQGGQPITGAHIYLFKPSSGGRGAAPASLLHDDGSGRVIVDIYGNGFVTADGQGAATIGGLYNCPTDGSPAYLLAIGGNPNSAANPYIKDIAVLPYGCMALAGSSDIHINALTTISSAYAEAAMATVPADTLSVSGQADLPLTLGGNYANTLVNIFTGQAQVGTISQRKINALGNILASCVNSTGGPCQTLFGLLATPDIPVTNTYEAALAIARRSTDQNLAAQLFGLIPPITPYQPTLTTGPTDWALASCFSPTLISGLGQPISLGSTIRLDGTGFGAASGSHAVVIGGSAAPIINWQTDHIDVVVPADAAPTTAQIFADGYASAPYPISISGAVAPVLTVAMSADPITYGQQVSAIMSIGSAAGTQIAGSVTCGNATGVASVPITINGAGTYSAALVGLPPGDQLITCVFTGVGGTITSANAALHVDSPVAGTPIIFSLARGTAGNNSYIIQGQSFGIASGTVTVSGSSVTVDSWSDSQIVIHSVSPLTAGNLAIVTAAQQTATIQFNLVEVRLQSLSVTSGPPNVGIALRGSFGFDRTALSAFLGTEQLHIISSTPYQLLVQIPSDGVTGSVTVRSGGTEVPSAFTFTVLAPAACSARAR